MTIVTLAVSTLVVGFVAMATAFDPEISTMQKGLRFTSFEGDIERNTDATAYFPYSYLDGQTIQGNSDDSTWSLKFFDRASQEFCLGPGQCTLSNIGYFNGMVVDEATGMRKLILSGGSYCGDIHGTRSGHVLMFCGQAQTLSVEEVSRCVYEFKATDPGLCTTSPSNGPISSPTMYPTAPPADTNPDDYAPYQFLADSELPSANDEKGNSYEITPFHKITAGLPDDEAGHPTLIGVFKGMNCGVIQIAEGAYCDDIKGPRSGSLVVSCGTDISTSVIVESPCVYSFNIVHPMACTAEPTVGPTAPPTAVVTTFAPTLMPVASPTMRPSYPPALTDSTQYGPFSWLAEQPLPTAYDGTGNSFNLYPFHNTVQHLMNSTTTVLVGVFSGLSSDGKSILITEGTYCKQIDGPRTATLTPKCGQTQAITAVQTNICTYAFSLTDPRACNTDTPAATATTTSTKASTKLKSAKKQAKLEKDSSSKSSKKYKHEHSKEKKDKSKKNKI